MRSVIPSERLAEMFVDIVNTLVVDYDVIDFLHAVADHAVTVSGAFSAGVLLTDQNGNLHHVAASNEATELLELFQQQNEEGPCLDCYRTGEPVVNSNLSEADSYRRWPHFAPRAADAGFESVHALPLRLHGQTIGALNLFGSADVAFEASDVRIVQALADAATIAILQERALARAETLTEQLQGALNSRVVIEQAKGAIAQYLGVSPDAAFELIRSYARHQQKRLTDISHTIVTNPAGIEGLNAYASQSKSGHL